MGDAPNSDTHWTKIVSDDLLSDPANGTTLRVEPLRIDPLAIGASPVDVNNWEIFDGALLAIGVMYGDHFQVEGTAVMIAPGLAISAKHILDDHYPTTRPPSDGSLMCLGLRANGELQAWHCYELKYSNDGEGDLALLSLKLISQVSDGFCFKTFPLTTRVPAAGERLTVIGFRFEQPAEVERGVWDVNAYLLAGRLYVSSGAAGVFSRKHDSVLAPYATIEVRCGSLGGMSGGAVVDSNGELVGVTSVGWQTSDQEGPTLAAWWVDVLGGQPTLSWPLNMYQPGSAVVDIPLGVINGRELIERTDDRGVRILVARDRFG